MGRILVVDDSAIVRELLALSLRSAGYQIVCASDGKEALSHLKSELPDLVLLDLAMPGIDGMVVLKAIRNDPSSASLPVILLTASSDKDHVVQAAQLGVRDYVLKSNFLIAELMTRIRKYVPPDAQSAAPTKAGVERPVAAAPLQHITRPSAPPSQQQDSVRGAAESAGIPLLTREKTLQRLQSAKLKTLPGAVAELLALVNSPRGTVVDVAQSLKRDPVLSARVLRVANSAAFASQRARISTVEDAVKHIGIATTRNLITTVGVFEAFGNGQESQNMLQTWQHSLAVATLMSKFTPQSEASPPGVAYIVGLCHDLAHIILRQYFREEYQNVNELTRLTGRPLREAESALFGLPASEMVVLVLSKLGLPGIVTAPIQEFFERAIYQQPPGAGSILGRSLRIANVYAHGLMLAPDRDAAVLPLSKAECHSTFGDQAPDVDDAIIRGEALTTAGVLAGLSEREMIESCEPPIPKRSLRLCYVRHDDYSDIDPLLAFLKLTTSEVDLRSRLPLRPQDLAQTHGMIIALRRAANEQEIADSIQQLAALLQQKPIPVMFLAGTCSASPENIPGISIQRLPTNAMKVGEFLGKVIPLGV